jgi:protein-tyrosine-phosphatase/DNA-binding HxlR family transcriptional regulator
MLADISNPEVRAVVHAALADAHRVAIVDELHASDRSPSELCEQLNIPSNLLAHHLGVLDDAGLIERHESHGDGRRRYLRLRAGVLEGLVPAVRYRAAEILFVCTANSARSQLAAALWNAHHPIPAGSAGTVPADRVHPGAVRAARRLGLDIKGAVPRALGSFDPGAELIVVTVCDRAHEDLAKTMSHRPIHWSIADPAAAGDSDAFDRSAREIAVRIDSFASQVVPVP